MKEIIYLDTNIMNSMLAQLDEGLINNFSLEQSDQETEGESIGTLRGKKAGISGGLSVDTGMFPGGALKVNGSLGNSGNESESYSRTILEGQKDILNKAFHDYALELLTQKLIENDLLNETVDLIEGDLHKGESEYKFYDFDLIKKSMDAELMSKIMLYEVNMLDMSIGEAQRIVSKPNPNARERELLESAKKIVETHQEVNKIIKFYETMNTFSQYGSNLLENLTVIKADNKIGLLKKEYLRESVESLTFRTDNSRKIKFLVRIIGRKDTVFNGFNQPVMANVNDLDTIPNMMLDIILGSFNIIEAGDLLVTPIAIYYE